MKLIMKILNLQPFVEEVETISLAKNATTFVFKHDYQTNLGTVQPQTLRFMN